MKQNLKFKKKEMTTFKGHAATIIEIENIENFKVGETINIRSRCKGHGFQGVVFKGAKGGPASHGSNFHRKCGSTGLRDLATKPGRVRAGRVGNNFVTLKNLLILAIMEKKLLLKGTIPGSKKSEGVIL